jgi:hypothetical protein
METQLADTTCQASKEIFRFGRLEGWVMFMVALAVEPVPSVSVTWKSRAIRR